MAGPGPAELTPQYTPCIPRSTQMGESGGQAREHPKHLLGAQVGDRRRRGSARTAPTAQPWPACPCPSREASCFLGTSSSPCTGSCSLPTTMSPLGFSLSEVRQAESPLGSRGAWGARGAEALKVTAKGGEGMWQRDPVCFTCTAGWREGPAGQAEPPMQCPASPWSLRDPKLPTTTGPCGSFQKKPRVLSAQEHGRQEQGLGVPRQGRKEGPGRGKQPGRGSVVLWLQAPGGDSPHSYCSPSLGCQAPWPPPEAEKGDWSQLAEGRGPSPAFKCRFELFTRGQTAAERSPCRGRLVTQPQTCRICPVAGREAWTETQGLKPLLPENPLLAPPLRPHCAHLPCWGGRRHCQGLGK